MNMSIWSILQHIHIKINSKIASNLKNLYKLNPELYISIRNLNIILKFLSVCSQRERLITTDGAVLITNIPKSEFKISDILILFHYKRSCYESRSVLNVISVQILPLKINYTSLYFVFFLVGVSNLRSTLKKETGSYMCSSQNHGITLAPPLYLTSCLVFRVWI